MSAFRLSARTLRLDNLLGLGVLSGTFVVAGCSSKQPDEAALAKTSQAIVQRFTVYFPSGTNVGEVALLASGALRIDDRVTVVDANNAPANVATTGSSGTNLGVGASTGAVVSVGQIVLRGSTVNGDATSSGAITLQNGSSVTGVQRPNTSVRPFASQTLTVDFDTPNRGPIQLEPPPGNAEVSTSLDPGHYSTVTIKSRNRVILSSGSYQFDSFDLEPQATLVINDSAGPVTLDVRNTLLYKGSIRSTTGSHPAFRLLYVGANQPAIETAFTGTFIAPNASVRLATPADHSPYVGSFVARELEVSPDTRVVFKPYFKYEVTQRWAVPTASYGPLDSVMDVAGGATLFATQKRVFRRESSGSFSDITGSDLACRIQFEPNSGRWACAAGGSASLRSDQGSLLGQFDTSDAVGMRMVPPMGDLAIFVGTPSISNSGVISALRIAGPSGTTTATLPDAVAIGVGAGNIVYSTGSALVRTTRQGATVWNAAIPLRQLLISDDGQTLVGMKNQAGSTVVHVDLATGTIIGETALTGAMRELHFSPDGKRSIAATATSVVAFSRGVVAERRSLALQYLTSAAITDAGDIISSGTDASGSAVIRCDGSMGSAGWFTQLGRDDHAYRPYVTVARSAGGFYAIAREGLYSYSVTRRF